MVMLLLVVCSLATGSCVEHDATPLDGLGLMGCMVGGSQAAAAYVEANPGFRVDRWRCMASPRAQKAA